MTLIAGDIPDYDLRSGKRDRVLLEADQLIGAAGAVSTLTVDDNGVTVAKNAGAGTYDLTFPKAIRAQIMCNVFSPANTVNGWNVTALNAAAGTAQIAFRAAGVATNPAAADVLYIQLWLDQRLET